MYNPIIIGLIDSIGFRAKNSSHFIIDYKGVLRLGMDLLQLTFDVDRCHCGLSYPADKTDARTYTTTPTSIP